MTGADDRSKKAARMVAKAWQDPKYKERLLRDPAGVLKEEGIHVAEGTRVHAHENTHEHVHVVIPARPKHLRDEDLHDHAKVLPQITSITITI